MNGAVIIVMLVMGVIGGAIGHAKGGKEVLGFVAGLILGPIGWLFIAILPTENRTCPDCKEAIKKDAAVCKHCGRRLGSPAQRPASMGTWHPDPTGRFTHRWWDGAQWTARVARTSAGGTFEEGFDPIADVPREWSCPKCDRRNEAERRFCGKCGDLVPT